MNHTVDIAAADKKFRRWVHNFGCSTSLFLFALMMLLPLLISMVYDLWPTFASLFPGCLSVTLMLSPWWPAETIGYMPIMGPGALYMSYITGNVTNLRMPVTVSVMNNLGLEPGSSECHTVAIIACGSSIIMSTIAVMVGLVFYKPLTPVMTSEFLAPGFNKVIPALLGGLNAQTVLKNSRSFLLFLLSLVINFTLGKLTGWNAAYIMLLAMAIVVVIAYFDYKNTKKKADAKAAAEEKKE